MVKNKFGFSISEEPTGAPLEEMFLSAKDMGQIMEELREARAEAERKSQEFLEKNRGAIAGLWGLLCGREKKDEETYPLP